MTDLPPNLTLSAMWKSYETKVIPIHASDIQVIECRQAFYSGAWAMLNAISRLDENDVEAQAKFINGIQDEMRQFVEQAQARMKDVP